ncbi:hypothetical protein [Chryseolinea soli]|nr:hypothetical protein [Chryseolinea soli]
MMKQIFEVLLTIGIGLAFPQTALAQTCECPIKGGRFKDFNAQSSHHSPEYSAVINSRDTDSVRSILTGKVFRIFTYKYDSQISVLIKVNDTTVVAYRRLFKIFVKEGDILAIGDNFGLAGKNEKGEFEIEFSYHEKLKSINQESILKCEKR